MKLIKEKGNTELIGNLNYNSIVDLVGAMIDFYASAFINRDKWCTKQERLFLIASIIISNKNIKYTSNEAYFIYKDIFNLKRQSDISGLFRRLEDNDWLIGDKRTKKIEILEFFKIDLEKEFVNFNIKLNIKDEGND